ncbi:ArsO family NAD(P)H-dependent flavin-containing monooxygenase [Streptomyces capparidis]
MSPRTHRTHVVVIGGGQAGLAAAYHLRRLELDFVVLDALDRPGGAWPRTWDSLHLFSPAAYSSLPGWPMPEQPGRVYPDAAHVAGYLAAYERRYALPVHRPVRVRGVHRDGDTLRVEADHGVWHADEVISATGTWWQPFVPALPGRDAFRGRQLHTVSYRRPADHAGQRVVVVGGGNSGAQIAADLAGHAEVTWVTAQPVRFLPDDVDGRALFLAATAQRRALDSGQAAGEEGSGLGDVVVVPSVRAARDRGLRATSPMFTRLSAEGPVWADGTRTPADAVIWCTGFRPALGHLAPLRLRGQRGVIPVRGTRAVGEPRLHLLGYGDWTGFASATLAGVARPAREAAQGILSADREKQGRGRSHTASRPLKDARTEGLTR